MKYKRGRISKVRTSSKDTHCNKILNGNLNSGSQKKQKTKRDSYMKSLQFAAQMDNLQESHIISTRTLKRGSPYLSQDEVNLGTALKFKITQTEGKRLQVIATSHEKVNVDVTTEDVSGAYRRKANGGDDDDDRVECSVGSCSINGYSEYNIQSKSNAFEDTKTYGSDAESTCEIGYEDEIHRLELQAYRCTIEALHASGPLTWEKETMVTNLRMFLHISNDEHLIMLKNLISTANAIRSR